MAILTRFPVALAVFMLIASSARATTVKEFESKSAVQQRGCVADYIQRMTTDLSLKNPQLGQDIRTWFTAKKPGRELSEGVERLYVELAAIDSLAAKGKADLNKIQVEGVILYVVKERFPPSSAGK